MTTLNSTMADSSPLTSRQFLSFETIAASVLTLCMAIVAWVWNGHSDEFKALRNDVKDIRVIIPTLATKAELDVKLDSLQASMNKLENIMTTQMTLNNHRLNALEQLHPPTEHSHAVSK